MTAQSDWNWQVFYSYNKKFSMIFVKLKALQLKMINLVCAHNRIMLLCRKQRFPKTRSKNLVSSRKINHKLVTLAMFIRVFPVFVKGAGSSPGSRLPVGNAILCVRHCASSQVCLFYYVIFSSFFSLKNLLSLLLFHVVWTWLAPHYSFLSA